MTSDKNDVEIGSNRSFGLVFTVVFLLIGLYPMMSGGQFRAWAIAISVIFVVISFSAPDVLARPNQLWAKLGLLLGSFIAPVVMGVVFYLTIVPTGLILFLAGKDIINKRLDKSAKSYWVAREQTNGTMKDQF